MSHILIAIQKVPKHILYMFSDRIVSCYTATYGERRKQRILCEFFHLHL